MIAMVTDSTACMTKAEAEALGVVYVNMEYQVDGVSYTDDFIYDNAHKDSVTFDMVPATTSKVPPTAFISTFTTLLNAGYEVLCLPISSRLSGTYNNALASAQYLGGDRIKVVDTKTTAGGLLLMIRRAREWINEGFPLSMVANKLELLRSRVQISFSVGSMVPIRLSGRLGLVRLSLGTVLNMRPILLCTDGAIVSNGMARGRQEQYRELIKTVPKTAKDIVVHYYKSKQAAEQLSAMLKKTHSNVYTIRKLCPTLGIHLGSDVVGIAWIE